MVLAYLNHLFSVTLSLLLLIHNTCEPLCNFIADCFLHFAEISSALLYEKYLIGKSKAEEHSFMSSSLHEKFDASLQCAVDFASVTGASS